MSHRLVAFLVGLSLLSGCASGPRSAAPAAVGSPGPVASESASPALAANDNLNAVAWAQTAIEHDLIYREVYANASRNLLQALADRSWDALPHEERTNPVAGLRPAVILDIDETVLDNSPYQAQLVRDGTDFNEATWATWCREAAAKPLPGALAFTQLAAQHDITVFYLSNRAQDLNEPTLENLRRVGFPIATGEKVFLGRGASVDGCVQKGGAKGCRRQLISRNYRVLIQVGDQIGDFIDVPTNTLSARRAVVEPYLDWVGQRWFVLPNPTYGSWEPALFNNDWASPAATRRRMKLEILKYN